MQPYPDNNLGLFEQHCESQGKRANGFFLPAAILQTLTRSSHQIFLKHPDQSIEGWRYVLDTEPSRLRPVRAWTVLIERWRCRDDADIVAEDILFLRIANHPGEGGAVPDPFTVVRDIKIHDEKIYVDEMTAFNAVLAAGVLINKIDSGRVPDCEKILTRHNLLDRTVA